MRQPEKPVDNSSGKSLRISLVTPNFNGADKLDRTLNSVLSQDYDNLDYVFMDGGSSDESMEIVERHRSRFSHVVSEPDRGLTDALNKGFARTNGAIMGWINSDDILFPGSLAVVNRVFQEFPDVAWLTGRASALNEADTVFTVREARPWSWLRFIAGDYRHIQQESTFWRRDLWNRAGAKLDEAFSTAADFELWTRFFRHAPIHTVDALVGGFRFRDKGQLSRPSGQAGQISDYERHSGIALKRLRNGVPAHGLAAFLDRLDPHAPLQPSHDIARVSPHLAIVDPAIIYYDLFDRQFKREDALPLIPQDFETSDIVRQDLSFDGSGKRAWTDGPNFLEMDLVGLDIVLRSHHFTPFEDILTTTTPAMPFLCGPIAAYDFGQGRFKIQLKFGDQVVFCDTEVRKGEPLRLKIALSASEYGIFADGDFLAKGPITGGAQNCLSAHLALGGGFLERAWRGIALGVRIAVLAKGTEAPVTSYELRDTHDEEDEALWPEPSAPEAAPPAKLRKPDEDLSAFQGIHAGKRCFVMGNGPSLNKMDLSMLDGEDVFACNSAFLLFDRVDWRPRYYTCVDTRVLRDRAEDISRMLDRHPDIIAFFPDRISLHDGTGRIFETRTIIPPAPNRYYFNEEPNSLASPPETMFSLNVNDRVVQPYTVAITMLQLAAYMGYSTIYLIGCDTSYSVGASVKQQGPKLDGVGLLLTSTEDNDPNHFDPTYFGAGREWHNPQVDKMIMHYGWAKKALESSPTQIINATVGGNLEVFERADFKMLFPTRSGSSDSASL